MKGNGDGGIKEEAEVGGEEEEEYGTEEEVADEKNASV